MPSSAVTYEKNLLADLEASLLHIIGHSYVNWGYAQHRPYTCKVSSYKHAGTPGKCLADGCTENVTTDHPCLCQKHVEMSFKESLKDAELQPMLKQMELLEYGSKSNESEFHATLYNRIFPLIEKAELKLIELMEIKGANPDKAKLKEVICMFGMTSNLLQLYQRYFNPSIHMALFLLLCLYNGLFQLWTMRTNTYKDFLQPFKDFTRGFLSGNAFKVLKDAGLQVVGSALSYGANKIYEKAEHIFMEYVPVEKIVSSVKNVLQQLCGIAVSIIKWVIGVTAIAAGAAITTVGGTLLITAALASNPIGWAILGGLALAGGVSTLVAGVLTVSSTSISFDFEAK